MDDEPDFPPDPIHVPITDVLDLHTFLPGEVPDLLDDYFRACLEAGIHRVRIIHGKGKGVLRDRVFGILRRHPLVSDHRQAPPGAGGWGAVLVALRQGDDGIGD